LYTNFTFCFSFWGTSSRTPTPVGVGVLDEALFLGPTGRLTSPRPPGHAPRREHLHCKILGSLRRVSLLIHRNKGRPKASSATQNASRKSLGDKKLRKWGENLPFCFREN